jgi:chemotaxis protein methyltransferase CheR
MSPEEPQSPSPRPPAEAGATARPPVEAARARDPDLEEIEVELLLAGLARHYGHDFRGYAPSALKRRVRACVRAEGLRTVSGLQELVLHDAAAMGRLLAALTTSGGALFRDPAFYLAFRRRVVPLLRTYPFVRIWQAGCSTGEDVYSMAILLAEEGLGSRVRLYATDIAESVLASAKRGAYAGEAFAVVEARYLKAGGRRALADHATSGPEGLVLRASLRDNVVFGQHNLATDHSFNEFNVVLCRDVLIHYTRELQTKVLGVLHESLCRLGVLGLGARESLRGSGFDELYEPLDAECRLFRRVG